MLFSEEEVLNSEKKCNYEETKVLGKLSRKEPQQKKTVQLLHCLN